MRKHSTRVKAMLLTLVMAVSLIGVHLGSAKTRFNDVPSSFWAANEITWAVDKGLMNGTTSTTFNPTGNTLRGQMTAILYRYAGSPGVNGLLPYSDVDASAYYATAAVWAKDNSILVSERLNASTLNPGDAIGRAEFCAMVYNFAKFSGVDTSVSGSTSFTDISGLSGEMQNAILWANKNGIVNGTSATTFNPNGSLTRAAATAMLYRYASKFDSTFKAPTTTEPEKPSTNTPASSSKTYTEKDVIPLVKGSTINVTAPVGSYIYYADNYYEAFGTDFGVHNSEYGAVKDTWVESTQRSALCPQKVGKFVVTLRDSMNFDTILMTINMTVTEAGSGSSGSTSSGNTSSGSASASTNDYSAIRDEIVRLTNEVRRENGVAELPTDDAMMKAAQAAAEYYASVGFWIGHDLKKEALCAKEFGRTYGFLSNLTYFGKGYTYEKSVADVAVSNWKNSNGHFQTMIDGSADNIGVGVATDSSGNYWCIQFFGDISSVNGAL